MSAMPPFVISLRQLEHYDSLLNTHALADWIEARLDEGLDWFCLSDIYGDGEHERRFGEALASRPALASRVHVMAKIGIVPAHMDPSGRHIKHYNTTPDYLTSAVEERLSRLNLEQIELLHLHRPDPLMSYTEVGRTLDSIIDQGKVARLGVSHFLPSQWRRLQAAMTHSLTSAEIELSIPRSAPLFDGLWDSLCLDGLAPMACSPLCGGRLFESLLGKVISESAQELNVQPANIPMAWLNTLPHAPTPVVGSLKATNLQTLLEHSTLTLERTRWFALLEAARAYRVF
ncbi:aldo/keto reductase [Larsenimonas rhizosphaerae]|uniref:Aldo/keto reductase n=1 Tax=Larsenimonas rhizosphaerae TaxID=2944682 RepID=A0AA41ZHR6_9GAMM|nr:aldo/keto reductase [Larsenimonas rhizosphaerae]MCM2131747.1 aldo/keto reductase [Larsenimonas rhizosphaerae]MCX2524926.1 aldo/keto reductase [Larsenimonas rhizosphaerae]